MSAWQRPVSAVEEISIKIDFFFYPQGWRSGCCRRTLTKVTDFNWIWEKSGVNDSSWMKGAWAVKLVNSILSSNIWLALPIYFSFSQCCVVFFHLYSLHARVLHWHVLPLVPLPASLVSQPSSSVSLIWMPVFLIPLLFFSPPSLVECSSQSQDPCVSTPLTSQRTLFASEQWSARVCARAGALCVSL